MMITGLEIICNMTCVVVNNSYTQNTFITLLTILKTFFNCTGRIILASIALAFVVCAQQCVARKELSEAKEYLGAIIRAHLAIITPPKAKRVDKKSSDNAKNFTESTRDKDNDDGTTQTSKLPESTGAGVLEFAKKMVHKGTSLIKKQQKSPAEVLETELDKYTNQ